MEDQPKTLLEAIRYFSNEQVCIDAIASLRWQDGHPVCPNCNAVEGERKHYWLANQRRWKCYACRKQFSVKVSTIFEDSPIGLDKWMVALWMLCNCKNGVSSYEIARATGITQKSAWFVLQRLRLVLKTVPAHAMGWTPRDPIEIDETYIGGKPRNMHAKRRMAMGDTVTRPSSWACSAARRARFAQRDPRCKTRHSTVSDIEERWTQFPCLH